MHKDLYWFFWTLFPAYIQPQHYCVIDVQAIVTIKDLQGVKPDNYL